VLVRGAPETRQAFNGRLANGQYRRMPAGFHIQARSRKTGAR
jgi:hypothetical protein